MYHKKDGPSPELYLDEDYIDFFRTIIYDKKCCRDGASVSLNSALMKCISRILLDEFSEIMHYMSLSGYGLVTTISQSPQYAHYTQSWADTTTWANTMTGGRIL
jgi:hypothetical protein